MFWQGALPRKFVNFKVQNEECHYYALVVMEVLSLGTTFENEWDFVERMVIHNTFAE
jgi:hypothetical protein